MQILSGSNVPGCSFLSVSAYPLTLTKTSAVAFTYQMPPTQCSLSGAHFCEVLSYVTLLLQHGSLLVKRGSCHSRRFHKFKLEQRENEQEFKSLFNIPPK